MNAWAKLVQKTYNANKHKAGYKLKNAMKDAKKEYKSMKNRGGGEPVNEKKNRKTAKKRSTGKNRK
jgi:hypothetical protein